MAKLRICLDPGHGEGYNPGAVKGYYEGTKVYHLANYLKDELLKYKDVEVILTRNDIKEDPTLAQRGKMAGNNNCQLFLSLHSDGFSSSSACGVSGFYSLHRPESKSLLDMLGNAVANLMRKGTGVTYYRGSATAKYPGHPTWDYYGVIRNSVGCDGQIKVVQYSYIIEHGFHSNPKECAWLYDENNLKSIAKVEADIIAKYFGKTLKDSEPVIPDTPTNVIGDLNFDGKFDETDVSLAKKALNGSYTLNESQKKNADVNNDGKFDSTDLLIMQRVLNGDAEFSDYRDDIEPEVVYQIGDEVKFKSSAKTWASGKSLPSWIKTQKLYIRSEARNNNSEIVVSILKEGDISGVARIDDLEWYDPSQHQTPDKPSTVVWGPGIPVKFKSTATIWATGSKIPSWVKTAKLWTRSQPRNNDKQIVVSIEETGPITGVVFISDLELR